MTYDEMKNLLNSIADPVQKLELVMDFGAHMPPPPENAECHDIIGCASRAQICISGNNFYGVADSALVRGVVAIITAMVNGKSPQEIKKMDISGEFAGLQLNLGVGRLGGVNSMIRFLQNL